MTHDPMAQPVPHKVVIMARGLGTRMRKSAEGVSLTADRQPLPQRVSRR